MLCTKLLIFCFKSIFFKSVKINADSGPKAKRAKKTNLAINDIDLIVFILEKIFFKCRKERVIFSFIRGLSV